MSDALAIQHAAPPTGATAPVTPTPAVERPQGLPEKFKSVDDLAKSYAELEKKLGTGSREQPQAQAEAKTPGTTPAVPAIPQVPQNLAIEKFESEYAQNGQLSPETYAALEKEHKIPKAEVDKYISFRQQAAQAQAEVATRTVFEVAGSEESYKEMVNWAAQSLQPQEREAYNAVLNRGDAEQIKLAVAGLKSKFHTAFGTEPNLHTGRPGASGAKPYESTEQLRVAMSDPRYAKDPAYRKEVERRLAVSE